MPRCAFSLIIHMPDGAVCSCMLNEAQVKEKSLLQLFVQRFILLMPHVLFYV